MTFYRREFIKWASALSALSATGCASIGNGSGPSIGRVVSAGRQ